MRLREVLTVVDLEGDVYRLGLRSRMSDDQIENLSTRVLEARDNFRERLAKSQSEHYVEMFDPDRYVVNASVMENLIFGVADNDALNGRLEDHPYLASVIAETGLETKLLDMGKKVAETLIELFGDLAPNNPLLERMELMAPDEMETYRAIVRRVGGSVDATLDPADQQALMRLAFGYVEPRQRHGLLDETLQAEIIRARKIFGENLPADLRGTIEFYQTGVVNPAATVQDNVLFGRIVDTYAEAGDRVNALLRETMDTLELTGAIIELGLAFDIGSGAKRLSLSQQQKLALGRAIMKRPDVLVVNRALAALDANAQDAMVTRVLDYSRAEGGPHFAMFWVLSHPGAGQWFDQVLTFENGRIAKSEVRTAGAKGEHAARAGEVAFSGRRERRAAGEGEET